MDHAKFCLRKRRVGAALDTLQHGRVVQLASNVQDLQEHIQIAKADHEKWPIQRQIDATDRQIDQLVYELYDLTDEEIRIVEEVTRDA